MRRAMAEAAVGDDVYGEDPTVNTLQERVAELLGKEAALFMPSGTMSNQVALRTHTEPGDEVICEIDCHVFNYESAAAAALSGLQYHPLPGDHGILQPHQIETAIRPPDHHYPRSRLITLENTHNRAGGVIYPLALIQEIGKLAHANGLRLHLDGARLWNAAIATGVSLREYAAPCDSVSVCFSKGLGAPIGSALVGTREFIERAHRFRKMFGGGMRQVGVLAAAALYALEHNLERLAEDHRRARILAETLADLGYLEDELQWVHTNIVILAVPDGNATELAEKFRQEGLLVSVVNRQRIRLVTHLDFNDRDLEQTRVILKRVLQKGSSK